MRREDTEQK